VDTSFYVANLSWVSIFLKCLLVAQRATRDWGGRWKVEADGIHGIQRQNGDRFHRVLQYKHDDSGKYGCWYLMVGGGAQLQSRQSSTTLPGLEHMHNIQWAILHTEAMSSS